MLLAFILIAAAPIAPQGAGTEEVLKMAGKTPSKQQAAAASKVQSEETMLINPESRANDWAQAYKFLTMRQSAIPVSFSLANGQKIENIVSVFVMSGGTLLAFQLNTPSGMRYEIVKVEDIADIHQP